MEQPQDFQFVQIGGENVCTRCLTENRLVFFSVVVRRYVEIRIQPQTVRVTVSGEFYAEIKSPALFRTAPPEVPAQSGSFVPEKGCQATDSG